MSLQVDQQCKLLQETAPYPVTNQGADMGCLSMGRVLNEVIGLTCIAIMLLIIYIISTKVYPSSVKFRVMICLRQ